MSENQSAHLAARLIPVGDTSLVVEWFKDGKVLETGQTVFLVFIHLIILILLKKMLVLIY